jgi:hypothetical protein
MGGFAKVDNRLVSDLDMRNGYKGGVKVLSSRGWAKGKTRGEYRFSSLMK